MKLKEAKCKLIDMMLKEYGQDFTFGWLKTAYIHYDSHDLEEGLVIHTLRAHGIEKE